MAHQPADRQRRSRRLAVRAAQAEGWTTEPAASGQQDQTRPAHESEV
jgi:hypothetical protein